MFTSRDSVQVQRVPVHVDDREVGLALISEDGLIALSVDAGAYGAEIFELIISGLANGVKIIPNNIKENI